MNSYKFVINEQPYEVVLQNLEGNQVTAKVNGTEYRVTVEGKSAPQMRTPSASTSKGMGKAASVAAASSQAQTKTQPQAVAPVTNEKFHGVKAPIPGLVKRLCTKEGDRVKKGQQLLVLEAMKLENDITALQDGLIKKILVKEGDSVNQDQPLVSFE